MSFNQLLICGLAVVLLAGDLTAGGVSVRGAMEWAWHRWCTLPPWAYCVAYGLQLPLYVWMILP